MALLTVGEDKMPCADLDRRDDRISPTVVAALADAADTDPIALSPPLYEVVDGDALDVLHRDGDLDRVSFTYDDRTVVVCGDGTVEVDGTVYDA